MVLEAIATINQAVNNFVGHPGDGVHHRRGAAAQCADGLLQIRKFPYTIKTTIGRMFRKRMPLTVR